MESSLGQRMKAASEKKLLFREQPFVIARKASELEPEWQCEEDVLVQGIIDGYFIEDEEIVLVDYKTDFVRRGEEQKLIDRFQQLVPGSGVIAAGRLCPGAGADDRPESEGTVYLFVYARKRNSVVRNIVVKNKSQRPNTYFAERFGL